MRNGARNDTLRQAARTKILRWNTTRMSGLGSGDSKEPAMSTRRTGLSGLFAENGRLWEGTLTQVRSDPPSIVFDGEHVSIEVSDPLTALYRQIERSDGVCDKRFDFGPEESGVALG